MTNSSIRPGTLVWYPAKGLGKVREVGGNPQVLFWSDQKSGVAQNIPPTLLTTLKAALSDAVTGDEAEGFDSWSKKSPLKLVALALTSCGGKGTESDIRDKLNGRAPLTPNWGNWWKRTQPKIANLPSHFGSRETSEVIEYTLLSSVADVPADWTEPKSASLADWKNWLLASTHEPPPGRFPTKPVGDTLAKWAGNTIEQALFRALMSGEEFSASDSVSAQAAEGWFRAVAQASLRWRETGGTDTRGYMAARVGELLARLSRIAGERTPQEMLLSAGVLDGEEDAWRRGFVAGMWEAFEGEDARNFYLKSSTVLGRQARGDLAREIALGAFGSRFSSMRHIELDRLLDAVPEGDRRQLLQEMISNSSSGSEGGALDFINRSRHAAEADQMELRMMAVLALQGGESDLGARTSRELADILELEGSNGATEPVGNGQRSISNPPELLRDVKNAHGQALARLRQSHEIEIKREQQKEEELQREISRLSQQIQERNAELDSRREESRLEIRQDMLLAVGEVLQSLCLRYDLEGTVGDIEAGLALALRAGGAELLENAGASISFQPRVHETEQELPDSAPVKVLAPGVIVRNGIHGDRVLLKAQVKHEVS